MLLLVGCGDNLAGIAPDERDARETEARCSRLTRCGLFEDSARCVAYFRATDQRSLLAAIGAGIVRYDAIAEASCLDSLTNASCDRTLLESRLPSQSCQASIVGVRAAGSACMFDDECNTGRCDRPTCARTTCCAGTCSGPAKATGGTCATSADCSQPAYCNDDKLCHALESNGGPCVRDNQCASGLGCVGSTPQQAGACRKLPGLNEACPYGRCADIGARCISGTCAPAGLPGSECTTDGDCSEYAECDSGRCAAIPALGMPCTLSCAGAAFCSNGTCAEPLSSGDKCLADNECESSLCEEGPIFDACAPALVCF